MPCRKKNGQFTACSTSRNRAGRRSASDASVHQRVRAVLDGGYNYHASRAIPTGGSLAALQKRIETRMRMLHAGVAPYAQKNGKEPEARKALEAAYKIIDDYQSSEYERKRAEREPSEGSAIVRLTGGASRRFYDTRRALDWASDQLKGMPAGSTAGLFHVEGPYFDKPYSVLIVNEHGRVNHTALSDFQKAGSRRRR